MRWDFSNFGKPLFRELNQHLMEAGVANMFMFMRCSAITMSHSQKIRLLIRVITNKRWKENKLEQAHFCFQDIPLHTGDAVVIGKVDCTWYGWNTIWSLWLKWPASPLELESTALNTGLQVKIKVPSLALQAATFTQIYNLLIRTPWCHQFRSPPWCTSGLFPLCPETPTYVFIQQETYSQKG